MKQIRDIVVRVYYYFVCLVVKFLWDKIDRKTQIICLKGIEKKIVETSNDSKQAILRDTLVNLLAYLMINRRKV